MQSCSKKKFFECQHLSQELPFKDEDMGLPGFNEEQSPMPIHCKSFHQALFNPSPCTPISREALTAAHANSVTSCQAGAKSNNSTNYSYSWGIGFGVIPYLLLPGPDCGPSQWISCGLLLRRHRRNFTLLGMLNGKIEPQFVTVLLQRILGIMVSMLGLLRGGLQTSFITTTFGFALFSLRGVAPYEVSTINIYRGALPFAGLQVAVLALIIAVPGLVDWLPGLAGALSRVPMT